MTFQQNKKDTKPKRKQSGAKQLAANVRGLGQINGHLF